MAVNVSIVNLTGKNFKVNGVEALSDGTPLVVDSSLFNVRRDLRRRAGQFVIVAAGTVAPVSGGASTDPGALVGGDTATGAQIATCLGGLVTAVTAINEALEANGFFSS